MIRKGKALRKVDRDGNRRSISQKRSPQKGARLELSEANESVEKESCIDELPNVFRIPRASDASNS